MIVFWLCQTKLISPLPVVKQLLKAVLPTQIQYIWDSQWNMVNILYFLTRYMGFLDGIAFLLSALALSRILLKVLMHQLQFVFARYLTPM